MVETQLIHISLFCDILKVCVKAAWQLDGWLLADGGWEGVTVGRGGSSAVGDFTEVHSIQEVHLKSNLNWKYAEDTGQRWSAGGQDKCVKKVMKVRDTEQKV